VAAMYQNHVLGLEVAVNDAARVGFAERVAQREDDVERAPERERAAFALEHVRERGPVQELEREIRLAAWLPAHARHRARRVHDRDVGVLETRCDRGLAPKPS